jgi:hypothetical protein
VLQSAIASAPPQSILQHQASNNVMSRSGSRYPSAFGHTPSYRSYVKGMDSSLALPSSSVGLGSRVLDAGLDYSQPLSTSYGYGAGLAPYGSGSHSSTQSKVSTSSYSSVSRDGRRPVESYAQDSTYRASATGPSGVPHHSYAHSSSNYSSDQPWKNRSTAYSYNI